MTTRESAPNMRVYNPEPCHKPLLFATPIVMRTSVL